MADDDKKCPWCGAEMYYSEDDAGVTKEEWKCGTDVWTKGKSKKIIRGIECYERQVKQLKKKLRLKKGSKR